MRQAIRTSLLVALPSLASAGGSFELVEVTTLRIFNDVDFELVVRLPAPEAGQSYRDPYMGNCTSFTVHGTHDAAVGHPRATHAAHLLALERLRIAHEYKLPINFGWMGHGFYVIDPKNPCIVKSRALEFFVDRDVEAVMSHYGLRAVRSWPFDLVR
ncbi:MAG: hypothetical protein LBE81_05625 [Azonexus sp.]|nr:hypothetical protein [Azonexus sp.]